MTLPVWMYWEGERPDWISCCERTVRFHVKDVRILSPSDFDALRVCDRDIELSSLCPAHRADFIRAFLLRYYGGLWLDADCLVLKDLQPCLDLLNRHEFVGYRERQGHVANNFMAACPDTRIITAFYENICSILRKRSRLHWLTLGSTSLTRVIRQLKLSWFEVDRNLIQPVCWSRPGVFFAIAGDKRHAARINERSICYMLANTTMRLWSRFHPHRSLLEDGTFFRYVYQRALAQVRHSNASCDCLLR